MRTLIHAAFLAGLLLPVAGAASAADLDYEYGAPPPPPPVVRVLPPRPFCGIYRPCFPRWRRAGFYGPRFARPFPPPYAVGPRPHPEGYGYDYDRERYERANEHVTRYGYVGPRREPRGEPYGEPRRDYGPRERYDRTGERFDRREPYADPLGHGRGRGFDRDERGPGPDERFDRGPYGRG